MGLEIHAKKIETVVKEGKKKIEMCISAKTFSLSKISDKQKTTINNLQGGGGGKKGIRKKKRNAGKSEK